MKQLEIWKAIPNYEDNYEVSNYGRIKNKKGHIMALSKNRGGYLKINLCKQSKYKTYSVHRLVAITFLPNFLEINEVNHKDGNKFNNYVENLEWVTHSENTKHAYNKGLIKITQKKREASRKNLLKYIYSKRKGVA